ncbi:hypothetical protein KY284_005122 [Solanum tuberosum]|nr:hypothetical protein KY284_005122 [Solanum tuberosum]
MAHTYLSQRYQKFLGFSRLLPKLNLLQRNGLEFFKDYDMNVLYHPGKANEVDDALSRLPVVSVAHVEKERKELAKDVHRLARLGVFLMSIFYGGVTIQNGSESSLVAEVTEKQESDPILLQLKGAGRLCVPKVGSTKIYRDLREVFWRNGMKRDIANFVAKCPNCQQVKVEHQKPGGMPQEINIPTWKWEVINMNFITSLPHTRIQHDYIWVIIDRVTKSAHFLVVKTTDSAEDYAKLYINVIVRLHGTDGQEERTIQTLEDMLRACVIDFKDSWDCWNVCVH